MIVWIWFMHDFRKSHIEYRRRCRYAIRSNRRNTRQRLEAFTFFDICRSQFERNHSKESMKSWLADARDNKWLKFEWQTIIRAHERSQYYEALLQNIHEVIFMRVFHREANLAYWISFVANILQVDQIDWRTNTNFVETLKRNSRIFVDISTQFVKRTISLTIRIFFEIEKLRNQIVSVSCSW